MRNLLVAKTSMRRTIGAVIVAAFSRTPVAGTACPALCGFRAHHGATRTAASAVHHEGHGSDHGAAQPVVVAGEAEAVPVHPQPPGADPVSDARRAAGVAAGCGCRRSKPALSRAAPAVRIDTGTRAPTPGVLARPSKRRPRTRATSRASGQRAFLFPGIRRSCSGSGSTAGPIRSEALVPASAPLTPGSEFGTSSVGSSPRMWA